MKLSRVQMCIYFILQIVVISFCEKNIPSESSSENTPDQDELIDPHSIYYNRHLKKMQKPINDENRINSDTTFTTSSTTTPSTESVDSLNCDCDQKMQECRAEQANTLPFEIYCKRLVNMLLSHGIFKEENEIVKGNVYIEATTSQIQVLRDFGSGKVSIRTVDSVLSKIIKTPSTTFFEDAITYSELLFSTINTHRYTCIGILVAISIIFISRYIRWTRGAVILLIIDLIFIISFFMTWYQLVKEAEIKQTAKQMMYHQMPIECQPEKMDMMQYIAWKFSLRGSTEKCEKYVESMIMDPVVQVTPAQALSHLCTNFILHPVSLAGHTIGNFVDNATEKMSWPMKWVVTLLLFTGVVLLIIMLPFSLLGGSFGFGIGPLFHFTLNGVKEKEKRRVSEVKQRERIELIREVPVNITIQRIELSYKKEEETTKFVELNLDKKGCKDEEAQPENSSTLDCFDKAKGDSATVDGCKEETLRLELSNKEDRKTKTVQEVGSGDN